MVCSGACGVAVFSLSNGSHEGELDLTHRQCGNSKGCQLFLLLPV